MIELEPKDFKKLLPLVSELYYDLPALSVISGITPGRIWVDDTNNIRSALLWEHSQNSEFHFMGRADNSDFNRSLEKLFKEQIYPQALKKFKAFIVQYANDDWKALIPKMVNHPMEDSRMLYIFRPGDPIPDQDIPSGFQVLQVDEKLLSETRLKNLKGITDQIDQVWRSHEEFLGYGFGFCAVKGTEIASWCLAEYASPGRSGLGVETVSKFRRKGLATAVSAACLDYCAANNLTAYWICWKDNKPSIATANRLELQLDAEYPIYYGWFDELDNALSNASLRYRKEDFQPALDWFEKAFAMADRRKESYLYHELKLAKRYYYAAAVSAAVLEDKDSTTRYLQKAFEHGFDDFAKAKKEERFKIIHRTDVWKRILRSSG
ncbi:GNAT family N-acetyltransferase [candidate division WOR-3 bacterium]|uniref:GNAT family N-acetyltransferase n=1 Tax=candidate division WOR-3 bacterium TaxID=2052148 RepID=A0A9D5KCK3_UNCW3|nr:GNAT family N-acetyltransferase [candidate division WOR-3 bacterium]MBD3365151.1 GNAT family N-acetyltransferase [candidate division WOR-3 bacterium]